MLQVISHNNAFSPNRQQNMNNPPETEEQFSYSKKRGVTAAVMP